MKSIGLSGVKQRVVDIRRPVIERREQESQLRRCNHLPRKAVELIVPREESQLRLLRLDRADGTDKVREHLVRGICIHLVVFVPMGNVIGIIGQKNQIVALLHVQGFDDLLIECLPQLPVLQRTCTQIHQKLMFLTVHHLLC